MSETMNQDITIGEKYGPAMDVQTEDEARVYFERCVTHTMEHFGKSREEAEAVERSNIGYYMGYYDSEPRDRVARLYGPTMATHPIFGEGFGRGNDPTPEQAFEAGRKAASIG